MTELGSFCSKKKTLEFILQITSISVLSKHFTTCTLMHVYYVAFRRKKVDHNSLDTVYINNPDNFQHR